MCSLQAKQTNQQKYSILINNISAAYNNGPLVLKNIDLKLPAGKLISIVGPNGAGKSTLFYLLIGMKKPLNGKIKIFGKSVKYQRNNNNIAYVPQQEEIDLDYPIRVWNVVLGGRYGHMKSASGWKRFLPPGLAGGNHKKSVKKALKAVNMFSFHKRPLRELSGGQQKRVFLARALAQNAKLLLLDEPLAGIDQQSEDLIINILKKLKKQGRTIVMISHNLSRVQNNTDQIILLNKKIIDTGSPREVLQYNNLSNLFLDRNY